jgi:hypothetical protein
MVQFDIFQFGQVIWEIVWQWLDPPGPPPKDYSGDPEVEKNFKKLLERNPRFSDPIYKKNLQKLIEHHRKFEEKE